MRTTIPFLISDVVALAASGALAFWAVGHFLAHGAPLPIGLAMLAPLPLLFAYWLCGLYTEIWMHSVVEFRQTTRIASVALAGAGIVALLDPRLFAWFAIAWLPIVALVPLLRTIVRFIALEFPRWGYPTLIIGSGAGARELTHVLLEAPRSGLRPVLLTDPYAQSDDSLLPVVTDVAACASMVRNLGIRHAVVSLPDLTSKRMAAVLDRYSELVPHVLVLSDASTLPSLWGAWRHGGGGLGGAEVRNGLLSFSLQIAKRLIDITVAGTALLLFSPALLVIMALIKLTSPGPIFYGHPRIGAGGKIFKAWKLRTMRPNGDEILRAHLANNPEARAEWEAEKKLRHDPRVTWIGNILRKTSLDEMPQTWNVLQGDMSLVGPRPLPTDDVGRYGTAFRLYVALKPGITGLWQVSGRNDIPYHERIMLDVFYIRHWSLWLDVYILAKTVVALLSRKGAY